MDVAVQHQPGPLESPLNHLPLFAIHRNPTYSSTSHHQLHRRTMSLADPYAHLSSTARRLAIKRAGCVHPRTNFAQDRQISPDAPKDQVVSLGTIDFGTIIRSINLIASSSSSQPQTSSVGSTSPKSPLNGLSPALPTTTRQFPNSPIASSSFQFRFKVPITPRPVHRLPLFHPHNTAPLPPIAQPTLIHTGPSPPPPRRSSARARKPAAKADGSDEPAPKRSHKRKSNTAPSPLSNELARAAPAPTPPKKRKTDEEGRKPKPKAARPRKRLRSNSGSGAEKDKNEEVAAPDAEDEKDEEKERGMSVMEVESPVPAPALPAVKRVEEEPKASELEEKASKQDEKEQDTRENTQEEDDEDEVVVRRTINIFQEPPEPKPRYVHGTSTLGIPPTLTCTSRPRPTYKNHLKRSSTSSFNGGDGEKPSRPRKARKTSSAGGSISMSTSASGTSSRKDSTEPKDSSEPKERSTEPKREQPDPILMEVERAIRQSPIPEEIMAQ